MNIKRRCTKYFISIEYFNFVYTEVDENDGRDLIVKRLS